MDRKKWINHLRVVDFGRDRKAAWDNLPEPKPVWEVWKRILRMPHIENDFKLAKQQWDKILERAEKKKKKVLDSIIFKV
jgi:hypothetical protein